MSKTPTVRFPHRSRRGILLGLTAPQLVLAGLSGLLLLTVVLVLGVTGALQLLPLWALLAAAILLRHRGRSLADWAPIVARFALRRIRGQLVWLVGPSSRPRREGLNVTTRMPRDEASIPPVTARTALSALARLSW